MATKPKPKPKPPDPDEDEAARAADSIVAMNMMALDDRVAALEERMTRLELEAKEPPIRLGRRA